MATTTRPATADDLPAIFASEHDYMLAIEPEHEPRWLRARDKNQALWEANLSRTTMLEVNGGLAGYAMWTSEQHVATLITINVAAAHRRHGYGLRLLDVFVEQATTQGFTELRLGVHRGNPAQNLYPRAGFALVGTDEDYLLMRLIVDQPGADSTPS